jgi:hypothetical protein
MEEKKKMAFEAKKINWDSGMRVKLFFKNL